VIAFGIYREAAQSHALDGQVAQLAQQNAALERDIADRRREVVEAQTDAWLVEEARRLGYVFPGEKVFVLSPSGQAPPVGGVAAPLPSFSASPSPAPSPSASPSPSAGPQLSTPPPPTPHS
jgi:hypothetical protein